MQGIVPWLLSMYLLWASPLLWGAAPHNLALLQGYTQILEARHTGLPEQRDALLGKALDTFKEVYQVTDPRTKIQALLGAAQCYLALQTLPRRFPFLWQAPPLQRAEKSLLQALVLQPENGAAALLLGQVYHRRTAASAADTTARQQREKYLKIAAAQGLPVLPGPPPEGIQAFRSEDDIVALQYLDSRGLGRAEELVFLYRSTTTPAALYGVVIVAQTAIPLRPDPTSRHLAQDAVVVGLDRLTPPASAPGLQVRLVRGQTRLEERFLWQHDRLVYAGQSPLATP